MLASTVGNSGACLLSARDRQRQLLSAALEASVGSREILSVSLKVGSSDCVPTFRPDMNGGYRGAVPVRTANLERAVFGDGVVDAKLL
jgi:hypothetical protein